jgi:hypothetical protein
MVNHRTQTLLVPPCWQYLIVAVLSDAKELLVRGVKHTAFYKFKLP